MDFAWDESKNRANIAKHGIPLSRAMEMFDAPTVRYQDLRKDYGEIRFICYGVIGLRVHCCIYADRGDVRRIISLRKANKDESNDYFEAIGV